MSEPSRPSAALAPLRLIGKAFKAFFVSDVRLKKGARGLQVVLDEPEPKAAGFGPVFGRRKGKSDPAAERDRQETERILASLAKLLDEMPDNRVALRHLAFIEHALGKKGLRALHKVPYDALKRALVQFEGLVVNWSDEGLATLRSKMAVTLIEREGESRGIAPTETTPAPESANSTLDTAPLALPVALEGDDAAEAEAALRAAYGDAMLPGLELALDDSAPALEVQGELGSPSAQAIAKAMRRGDEVAPAARVAELQR